MSDEKVLHVGPGVDLPLNVVTSKAAILAMTGQGKTYLAKAIAEEMLNRGVQIVVGDYLGVWWGLTSSASGKSAGKNVVVFGGDHADVPINENAGIVIADLVVNERINAVLDVSGFEDDAPKIRFMTAFAKRLFYKNKRALHFFLDEADEFVPQQPQREQIQMLAILKRIWQRGRIKGIGGTIISQRSAVVHKTLLSQSEILIALRTVAPQDRAALEAWFESWGTEKEIDTFQKTISNLPQYHAWFWSPKHKLFVQGKARKLETFDSSATPDVEHGITIEEPAKRTSHDIARFGKEIERLAEVAASEDPDLLLRQNHELKKKADHWKAHYEAATEQVKLLEEHLKKRPEKVKIERPGKPIKVAAVSPKTLRQIAKARKGLATVRMAIALSVVDVQQAADRLERELERAEKLNSVIPSISPAVSTSNKEDGTISYRVVGSRPYHDETPVPARMPGRGSENGDGAGGKVTGGKRRILAALAQHGKTMAGRGRVLAGIKSIDTWNTYARAMKRAGLIESDARFYWITRAGLDALGDYEPLPTGQKLIDYWKAELGSGGKGKIFSTLLEKPKYAFPSEELAKSAGINSMDTLNTYVRSLKVLGLAENFGKRGAFTKIHSDFENL